MAWLLRQGSSPTAAASSTATPAASSAAPDKAHGILNPQILQHGEKMQRLLEASQTLSSLTCLNILILLEEPSQFAPFKPPRSIEDFQSEEELSTPISARDNRYVNVDSGDEAPRTEKRIFWTQEEDVRMMSSWLLNSTDSTIGADRKNDQYWTDVEATYNETTPSHRKRNVKQIKDRFHKVNKWIDLFHSAWLKARMIYTSGYNDQMWIEKAHVLYIKDNEKLNLGPFVLMEVWNTVKTEAKWIHTTVGSKQQEKERVQARRRLKRIVVI